jgi:hypothetical protein
MHAVIDIIAAFVVALAATAFAHLGITLQTEPRKPQQEPVVERTFDRADPEGEQSLRQSSHVAAGQSRAPGATRIC